MDTIKASPLNDLIVEVRGYAGEMTLETRAAHVHEVLKALKEQYGFTYMSDMTATDFYTDENRFEMSYNIVNIADRMRLRVSCRLPEEKPEVDSVHDLWEAAEWNEREAYDMMGIQFRNHPDLRRLYMPEDFEYFPQRKEFPLLGIPGSIQVPEKDAPKGYN